MFEVLPSTHVVGPHKLLVAAPQAEVCLLLDPVLDTGLVLHDRLQLEEEQHPHGDDHPEREAEPEQRPEQRPESEDDLGLGAGPVVEVPGAVEAVVEGHGEAHRGHGAPAHRAREEGNEVT